jgi:hypothetical protein
MEINLEEQYAWVDELLRYKFYFQYCIDLDNVEDLNDSLQVGEYEEAQDEEAQDSRLLERKHLRHYPLSEIDADIWQTCAEIMDVEGEESNDKHYCEYCDLKFDSIHEFVSHEAHCLGYDWQSTLEEGLYYENTLEPMDLEFEVGNMEWA